MLAGPGLVPFVSIGGLFAQGTLYLPLTAPVVSAAPASSYRYLAYNSSTGFYWTVNPAGATAGDAVLGWVRTNASDVIETSSQQVLVTITDTSGGGSVVSSGVTAVGAGAAAGIGLDNGIDIMVPDGSWNLTPDGSKGSAHYYTTTTNAVNVAPPINVSPGNYLFVVILQGASGRAVSWNAAYKGLSEYQVDVRPLSYASLMFQMQGDSSLLLLGVAGNGVLRA